MTDSNTYSITRLVSGNGLAEINSVIGETETLVNTLSSRIDNQNSKEALIKYNVPLASGTTAGMLVYYSTSGSNYAPARADLLADPGDQGQSIEAPCARVEGMIVEANATTLTGTLLMAGAWESADCVTACLGTGAIAGTYYLSPTSAGHAVLDPGSHLRQPVLSYHGEGRFFISPLYMAHDNHFHASALATGNWTAASTMAADLGVTAPSGAQFGYNHTGVAAFTAIGEMSNSVTSIFYNGVLQRASQTSPVTFDMSDFVISSGYLWTKMSMAPDSGSVTVFNHYPFAYGSAVLRSLESESESLTIVTNNGVSRLKVSDYVGGGTTKSALAVAALSGGTLLFTPVVTEALAGPGITLTKDSLGTVTISASNLVGHPVDAYAFNHNGTTVTSDGLFQYFTYPKSRVSEMVICLPVQDVPSGTTMQASTWAVGAGPGAVFTVRMWYLNLPTPAVPVDIPTTSSTPSVTTTMTVSGQSGKFTYAESAASCQFSADGMVVAAVKVQSAPASDVRLLRMGFKVSVVSSEAQTESSVTPASTTALQAQGTAGEPIAKYSLLYIDTDGRLRVCRSTSVTTIDKCVGVAMSAASNLESVTYLIDGIISDTNFSQHIGFSPAAGGLLYTGTGGFPSQTDPTSESEARYAQKIGVALTSSALQIRIGSAVLKETQA